MQYTDHGTYIFTGEGVIDSLGLFAGLHQTIAPQQGQMLGKGRLAQG